ncbi:MAG TPA: hypothetical protein VLX91_01985 [Candidatus Acidoferrales bacterium]|nr:hypothetical protein [Candidatus Acidoferrales bacterium]
MQTIAKLVGNRIKYKQIPNPSELVMDGVRWGRFDEVFTPAYWVGQAWLYEDGFSERRFRIGGTFKEEVAACLLGGYGIPAEIGLAAFSRIRNLGYLIGDPPSQEQILEALGSPFQIRGHRLHYRFQRQKSKYLYEFLHAIDKEPPPKNKSKNLRSWLMKFRGIGPKTASWITRNWCASDEVAILDIHIHRAGIHIGLFRPSQLIPKDYFAMEDRFLNFARSIGVRASILDTIIWSQMRLISHVVF